MGFLSFLKNLNLGVGMPHMATTTSAGTMQTKEFEGPEQANKTPLAGDNHEITGVNKDARIKSDESGSCTSRMDWTFNHPSRKDNVEGKLEEAVSGQRRLANFKGDQGLGNVASSENAGQIECKFYLLPGGCKYGNGCTFFHDAQVNFLGLPIRPGGKECPSYMRTGGCESASRCRFHHPDPTAVVGDILQDRKNGVPSQHQGPVEQLCGTPRPSENTSNEQTAFLGAFTPNRGVQQNVHWIGNPTTAIPLHPQEMNINDHRKTVPNKDVKYGFSGAELQQFEEYPQRPSGPECQYFMKTGYCKFKLACRYHHPKSNVSSFGLPEGLVIDNYQHRGTVQQMSATPLPSENCSNGQTAFSGPSSSVPDLFPPNQELKPNAQSNENQMATSPLDPPEINIDENCQELANKNTSYEFNDGTKSQQFDEYPQRPGKPECQYFVKTGYCKFKSACKFHHPKPNLSDQALPPKPMATSPLDPPEIKMDEKGQELFNKNTAHIFNGCTKSQQFDEYPQRPTETECQHFMKTGYCKFKSACRFHHPKPHISFQAPHVKPIATSPLNPPPPEIKKNKKEKKLVTKDTVQEFNGGVKSQQFDEYPQKPREPERQHFMKTGSSKGKSACRSHHSKSNLSVPAGPQKSDKQIICTHYSRSGNCNFGSACRFSHHIEHT